LTSLLKRVHLLEISSQFLAIVISSPHLNSGLQIYLLMRLACNGQAANRQLGLALGFGLEPV
jgi:hypothetical protein